MRIGFAVGLLVISACKPGEERAPPAPQGQMEVPVADLKLEGMGGSDFTSTEVPCREGAAKMHEALWALNLTTIDAAQSPTLVNWGVTPHEWADGQGSIVAQTLVYKPGDVGVSKTRTDRWGVSKDCRVQSLKTIYVD
jgi:hypothetical protein